MEAMATPIRTSGQAEAAPLRDRPLLDDHEAAGVAALFKVLSGTTRLRLLHALSRAEEVRVSDLAAAVDMSQQGVSNQLQRLVDQKILATRREGTSIYYRIVDPCVPRMLEFGLCLLESPGNACGQP
ncbi:DNA-binding transcriptional regulator, ArsR family [Lentzea albidocapillata]|uniref:DNA-binding transcriptional regulator, ArsR family n=2 Tax=Lentzea TaxID=165301 RepID=A0A1W2AK29_9PSEU|nr:DNA-binding transcriptional regulator, ArsR family [Lentzea albidocapillata]